MEKDSPCVGATDSLSGSPWGAAGVVGGEDTLCQEAVGTTAQALSRPWTCQCHDTGVPVGTQHQRRAAQPRELSLADTLTGEAGDGSVRLGSALCSHSDPLSAGKPAPQMAGLPFPTMDHSGGTGDQLIKSKPDGYKGSCKEFPGVRSLP